MHFETDSAFSLSTRAYIGQPSPALLLRPFEILSPSSLETLPGFGRASLHAAGIAPSAQLKKCCEDDLLGRLTADHTSLPPMD